jgi:acyl-CoA reductase-like NAD-dependent aldehyde dehydrogenase
LISPETEQVTAEVANSTAQDVDDAVQAAHRAFSGCGWRTQVELRIGIDRAIRLSQLNRPPHASAPMQAISHSKIERDDG